MAYNIIKIYKNPDKREEYDEYWYRFEETWSHNLYDFPIIKRYDFGVVRHTPKGVILDIGGRTRFVHNEGKKAYARSEENKAMQDLRFRKLKQRSIIRTQLDHVERAVMASEKLLVENGLL